jgi:hypothetical protein
MLKHKHKKVSNSSTTSKDTYKKTQKILNMVLTVIILQEHYVDHM